MQDFFIEFLKKQAGIVLLLLLVSWKLYEKLERLETQIQVCNDQKFKVAVDLTTRSNSVLEQNTAALNATNEILLYFTHTTPKSKLKLITAREGIK